MPKAKPQPKAADAMQSATEQPKTAAQPSTTTVDGKVIATGEVQEHGNPDPTPSGALEIVEVHQTEYAISLPKSMTQSAWMEIGHRIGAAMLGASWKVGDWVNFGIAVYGQKDYDALAQATGLSEQYLRNCSSVAARVEPALRTAGSVERFRLLLAMPSENQAIPEGEQKGSATRAETLGEKVARLSEWTMGELRAKQRKTNPALTEPPPPTDTEKTNDADTRGSSDAQKTDTSTSKPDADQTPSRPAMTAEGIYNMAKALTVGIEEMTPDRLNILATFEKKESRLKPLHALLQIAIEQVGAIRTQGYKTAGTAG
jgi:hypothetical protein